MVAEVSQQMNNRIISTWYACFFVASMAIIAALLWLSGCAAPPKATPVATNQPPITNVQQLLPPPSQSMQAAMAAHVQTVVMPPTPVMFGNCADFYWYGQSYQGAFQRSTNLIDWTDFMSFTVTQTCGGEICFQTNTALPHEYFRAVARYSVGTFTN